jgi:hypothetical protein
LADAYGIHFSVQAVDQGGLPMLPNGQQGVSREQAIRAAMDTGLGGVDEAHNLLPNVQVSAQYGLFTADRYERVLPSGQIQPVLQNRPAWVITFFGPGVVVYPLGLARNTPGAVHHFVGIVIDAATRQPLKGFS